MSRELFTAHLQAVVRLCDAAHKTEDPNAALGAIHRARSRLDAARAMAVIEADRRDAEHLTCTQALPNGPVGCDSAPAARDGELRADIDLTMESPIDADRKSRG